MFFTHAAYPLLSNNAKLRNFALSTALFLCSLPAVVRAEDPSVAPLQTHVLGTTALDQQTAYSMGKRLAVSADARFVEMAWFSRPEDNPSFGSLWMRTELNGMVSTVVGGPLRIEPTTLRARSITIDRLSDGRTAGLVDTPLGLYAVRSAGASSTGFSSVLTVPQSERFLRPRTTVTSGDVVHGIYTFIPQDNAALRLPRYIRSEPNVESWKAENSQIDYTSGDTLMAAETYAIQSRGTTLAVAWLNSKWQLATRVSNDEGKTWESPTVLDSPEFGQWELIADNGDGTAQVQSSVTQSPGGDISLEIGYDGALHTVWSVVHVRAYAKAEYTAGNIGAIIATDSIVGVDDFNPSTGCRYINSSLSEPIEMAPPAGGVWNQEGVFVPAMRSASRMGSSLSLFPQLAFDKDSNLVCVYTSPKNNDYSDAAIGGVEKSLFGHIWLTVKPSNSNTWLKPVDLTPTGKDCLYGVVARGTKRALAVGWQQDDAPGNTPLNPSASSSVSMAVYDLFDVFTSVDVKEIPANIAQRPRLKIWPNPVSSSVGAVSVEGDISSENGFVPVRIYGIDGRELFATSLPYSGSGPLVIPTGIFSSEKGVRLISVGKNNVTGLVVFE